MNNEKNTLTTVSGEELLSGVRKAQAVFEEINNLYLAANSVNQQLLATKAERGSRSGKKSAVIPVFVGLLAGNVVFGLVAAVFGGRQVGGAIGLALGLTTTVLVARKLKERFRQEASVPEEEVNGAEQQLDEISREIEQLCIDEEEAISFIPRDYRYYDAVNFFEHALANGRADSMKEAVNLYEVELHHRMLEQNSARALEMQQQQASMLAAIEANSAATSRNTGITATISVLNYLSR